MVCSAQILSRTRFANARSDGPRNASWNVVEVIETSQGDEPFKMGAAGEALKGFVGRHLLLHDEASQLNMT
jgi:hypothetical protein